MTAVPLEDYDRFFLRSRMLFALGLLMLFCSGAVVSAFQAAAPDSGTDYAWLAVVILSLAGALGFSRIWWRFWGDLRNGQKLVMKGEVDAVEGEGKRWKVKVGPEWVTLAGLDASGLQKGDQVKIFKSRSRVVLGWEKEQ